MKKLIITLLALVGAASLANAQMIRPSGVVKQTRVKIERERPTAGDWGDEVGRLSHSVGALVGYNDTDEVNAGVDYTAQYRFGSYVSVVAGLWAGYWYYFDDDFGIELRGGVKIHPIASTFPESEFQPYIAGWVGVLLPPYISDSGAYGLGSAFIPTLEIGCDVYRYSKPLYISLNINRVEEVMDYEDYTIPGVYLKAGVKF